ncbi:hypothetical protein [Amycolatopsis saalfeldensis]|uniref:Uncharacterized protein n=1 Tax=Amycolatopsis saalfeldensis TaxID=394193 RepID=A0A1H8Y9B1_9PSEU|nr:hypothetical protein [Amycolatopsis saalfeldensis]SEP48583.1 hypothetical protein SAMN04489732_11278 [Amycolatopsis saalfeldensis]
MTEYGRERERRRRTSALVGLFFLAALSASLAFKVGRVPAAAVPVSFLVLVYVLFTFVVWRDRRAEVRRRASGAAPSWSAQLPVSAALELGAKAPGRHSRQQEVGELLGRLSLAEGGLRWEPRKGDRNRGVGPVAWDRSWTPEVVSLWGPGSQGCLTLTRSDGMAVDLWIRHPADLRRALGSAEP